MSPFSTGLGLGNRRLTFEGVRFVLHPIKDHSMSIGRKSGTSGGNRVLIYILQDLVGENKKDTWIEVIGSVPDTETRKADTLRIDVQWFFEPSVPHFLFCSFFTYLRLRNKVRDRIFDNDSTLNSQSTDFCGRLHSDTHSTPLEKPGKTTKTESCWNDETYPRRPYYL